MMPGEDYFWEANTTSIHFKRTECYPTGIFADAIQYRLAPSTSMDLLVVALQEDNINHQFQIRTFFENRNSLPFDSPTLYETSDLNSFQWTLPRQPSGTWSFEGGEPLEIETPFVNKDARRTRVNGAWQHFRIFLGSQDFFLSGVNDDFGLPFYQSAGGDAFAQLLQMQVETYKAANAPRLPGTEIQYFGLRDQGIIENIGIILLARVTLVDIGPSVGKQAAESEKYFGAGWLNFGHI